MKKIKVWVGLISTITCFITTFLTGGLAMATKFPPNTDTLESPFVIASVQPSTGRITVKYNGDEKHTQPLSMINIEAINVEVGATEDQIDENLPWLGKSTPYWNYLIHYEEVYNQHPVMDYGPEERELSESRYPRQIDLDKETMHILYYSVRPGGITSTEYLYGKIDYSLCMKSAVYKPGVECRAENKTEGGVWYWPYYNGERLEVPKEEWPEWGIKDDPAFPDPSPNPTLTEKVTKIDTVHNIFTSTLLDPNTKLLATTPKVGENENQSFLPLSQSNQPLSTQNLSSACCNDDMKIIRFLLGFLIGFLMAQIINLLIVRIKQCKNSTCEQAVK